MSARALGCKAGELELGTEFSHDEGRTWLVVRTDPRYATEAPNDAVLRFMASPAENTGLSAWEEVRLDDSSHVLLERSWGSGAT